jgi:Skp family chaperone for outer membrane proteins
MKKILFSLVLLLSIVSANAADIAVLRMEDIIKNSIAMGKATKEIENRKKEVEKKLKKEEKALEDEKNGLEGQLKVLSQDVAQEKVRKFQEKVVKFQGNVRENEVALQNAYMNVINQITTNIKAVLSEMKNEKGSKYDFDVVLPSGGVVFAESELDLSSEVTSRLNKKYRDVKVVFSKK